jgi:CRISPR-associated protein Cmr3
MKVRVKVKPLEPLMLRGPGEFDPSARGVAASARSLGWPSPSTFTGTLISELLSGKAVSLPAHSWDDFIDKYTHLLHKDKAGVEWVRGPYLWDETSAYVPLTLDGKTFYVIDLNDLEYYLSNYLRESYESFRRAVEERIREIHHGQAHVVYAERTGVALRVRNDGIKAVREGFLYTETFTALRSDKCYAFEVEFSREVGDLGGRAVKFGGEGRVAKLLVDREVRLTEELKEFTGGYAVLLSPFLMVEPPSTRVNAGGGAQIRYKEVELEVVMGRIGVRGLGFAVAENRRKPLLTAIMEGAIVRVENCENAHKLGLYGCISKPGREEELLAKMGFGSFYPLKVV